MSDSLEKRGYVGIIWIDNPPVNAISVGVRKAIIDGVAQLATDPEMKVGVLACEGRTFMAGADITEFGKPPLSPALHDVVNAVEGSAKPIIAAIHGTAFGGGLESALACHYRVAVATAQGGLTRSETRHPARRRRHPASAAIDRRGSRARHHRIRRSGACFAGRQVRCDRQNHRRRFDRGRGGLCQGVDCATKPRRARSAISQSIPANCPRDSSRKPTSAWRRKRRICSRPSASSMRCRPPPRCRSIRVSRASVNCSCSACKTVSPKRCSTCFSPSAKPPISRTWTRTPGPARSNASP